MGKDRDTSGSRSRCMTHPFVSVAISPTDDEEPPAPLSVMEL